LCFSSVTLCWQIGHGRPVRVHPDSSGGATLAKVFSMIPTIPPLSLTLREAFLRWHDSSRYAKRTRESYLEAISHWERCSGNPPLVDLTDELLFRVQETFLASGHAFTTWNKVRRTLLAIFNHLGPRSGTSRRGLGIIPGVPWIAPLPEQEPEPRTVPREVLAAIYSACEHATWPHGPVPAPDWWRASLVLLFNVGMRRGEWLSLPMSAVDWEGGMLLVSSSKTGKRRPKPLHPLVVEHLQRICGERPLLFPHPRNGLKQLYAAFYRLQERAGVTKPFYHFHDLRRTCGTDLYAVSPGAASAMLGHSSIRITQRYYAHVDPALFAQAMERVQPFAPETVPDVPPTLRLFCG
ncbi:MAG: tyrosine-type recombinase/integrase, partial [Planctomycetia bacterium]